MQAVKQNGLSLQYAKGKAATDKKVVKTACKKNGAALKFASKKSRYGDFSISFLFAHLFSSLFVCNLVFFQSEFFLDARDSCFFFRNIFCYHSTSSTTAQQRPKGCADSSGPSGGSSRGGFGRVERRQGGGDGGGAARRRRSEVCVGGPSRRQRSKENCRACVFDFDLNNHKDCAYTKPQFSTKNCRSDCLLSLPSFSSFLSFLNFISRLQVVLAAVQSKGHMALRKASKSLQDDVELVLAAVSFERM